MYVFGVVTPRAAPSENHWVSLGYQRTLVTWDMGEHGRRKLSLQDGGLKQAAISQGGLAGYRRSLALFVIPKSAAQLCILGGVGGN